jgi:phosphoglucomutase
MPTSCALDRVAAAKGISCFEVPTGWKFFGNLMDSGSGAFAKGKTYTPFLCGEESFGTGSNHVREKDGMWAVLAWLQILAHANPTPSQPLVSVSDLVKRHWATYGRNYYARYDYEGVDKAAATKMMEAMAGQAGLTGSEFEGGYTLKLLDEFEYTDPVDGSVSKHQGVRLVMVDGSRIVFRLSGTGVDGATVRLYLEKYAEPSGDLEQHPFEVVKPLAKIALEFSKLTECTGRTEPSVIT